MFLGIFCGLFFGETSIILDGLGQAFIMLLKMTILPYLSVALIHGIGSLSLLDSKALIRKGVVYMTLFWVMMISFIYLMTLMFPNFEQPLYFSRGEIVEQENQSFLSQFIPSNPFNALANDTIPAVVLFSLLFGIALMQLKNKGHLLNVLETISSALMSIACWVSRLSPIGVFALVATAAGTITFYELEKIWIYIFTYIFATVLLTFVVFPGIVGMLTPVRGRVFMKEIRSALLLAFTTGNVLIILPFIVEFLKNLSLRYKIASKESRNTVETLVPIIYNFPTAGNLFSLLFILFFSSSYAQIFTFKEHIKLVISGIFTLFGSTTASIAATSFLLDKMHLPHDGLSFYLEMMPVTRHFQAMVTAVGVAVLTLLIHFSSQKLVRFNWREFFKVLGKSSVIIILGYFVSKEFFSMDMVSKKLAQDYTIQEKVESVTYLEGGEIPILGSLKYDKRSYLERIKENRVLRVGYNSSVIPFSYFNKDGDLLGFDVTFAHQLAKELRCRIEFVPFRYGELEKKLQEGAFDIAMSALTVLEERIRGMQFSEPYMAVERAFIVRDHRRNEFSDTQNLMKKDGLKIGVLQGSSLEIFARSLFPHADLLLLKSYDDALHEESMDILLWTKEEGTPWTLAHPEFSVVTPLPSLGKEYFAYAVPLEEHEFLRFVNYWLDIKKLDGFLGEQYSYWVMGEVLSQKPRWSILNDVLHWNE